MNTNISINTRLILERVFSRISSKSITPVAPNFDKGECQCEQLDFDFLSSDSLSNEVDGTMGSNAVKDFRINNLYQFLHNLGITDDEIESVANGTIQSNDKYFLIFNRRW